MINYDSILSAFDGKQTLLQWLKMVKKALDESILKSVDIVQNGEKVVFSFNFEDGTSISAPEVTLPKGDKGEKGNDGVGIVSMETTNSQVVGVNTESIIRVELSDRSIKQFKAYAKNGSNGNDGVSITGIDTVDNQVVGDETLTTLRANYSNGTTDEFVVTAKNGKDSVYIYRHFIRLQNELGNEIRFIVDSQNEIFDIETALSQIPNINGIISYYSKGGNVGIVSVYKTGTELVCRGFIYDVSMASVQYLAENFIPVSINDELLGVNL